MGFDREVKEKALVACGRFCCLCHKYCGLKIQVHHIKKESEGGANTFDNAIPLCFDCHADMGKLPHHYGNSFTEDELKKHRDNWYKHIEKGLGIYSTDIEILRVDDSGSTKRKPVFSGVVEFDAIQTIAPESVVLIAGKSNVGKTALARSIILHNEAADCLMISLKDGKDCFVTEMLLSEAIIPLSKRGQTCDFSHEEWERLAYSAKLLEQLNCEIDDLEITNTPSERLLYLLKTQKKDVYIVDDFDALLLDSEEIERYLYKVKQIIQKTKAVVIFLYHVPNEHKSNILYAIPESLYRFTDYAYLIDFVDNICSYDDEFRVASFYTSHSKKAIDCTMVSCANGRIINVQSNADNND